MDNFMLSLCILVTGFVVVFSVLILLIAIIFVYGKIFQCLNNRKKALPETQPEPEILHQDVSSLPNTDDNGIPEEVIAVIAAAVDSIYGEGKCRIKSVKRSAVKRPVWRTAGIIDNTRPFGSF